MKITTKFNLKDRVHLIQNVQKQIWVPCSFCSGSGRISGADNTTKQCPECYGNGGRKKFDPNPSWQYFQSVTIGEVRITQRAEYTDAEEDNIFDNYGNQTAFYSEQYMCYETGIGSGTLWPSTDLFKTKALALIECEKRNKKEIVCGNNKTNLDGTGDN